LGSFAAILLGPLILVVAVIWILFPILVLIKFNDLLKAQCAIHRALLAANTVRDELAKALQVDRGQLAERLMHVYEVRPAQR